jgi:hypothetical protein
VNAARPLPATARPLWRRPTFVVGLGLLVVLAVAGLATGGIGDALRVVLGYVLLSALAGVVVGWAWWGTRGRVKLVGVAAGTVVALLVTALVAPPDDGEPAAVDAAGSVVAAEPSD